MSKRINSGYQIHAVTYEGDLENSTTVILSGLSVTDAFFYLTLLSNFGAKSVLFPRRLADAYMLCDLAANTLAKFPGVSGVVNHLWTDVCAAHNDAVVFDAFENILGQYSERISSVCTNSKPYYCRIVESLNVYYVPSDILCANKEFDNVLSTL